MKNVITYLFVLLIAFNAIGQGSEIIIPKTAKGRVQNKNMKVYPEKFEAYIGFNKGEATYREDALNVLDSIYNIVFTLDNGMFYKITMIGYDDDEKLEEENTSLARDRVITTFRYFADREQTEYIIRRTPTKFFSSCSGEEQVVIKYKVPFDFKWINLYEKVPSEKISNQKIALSGKVHIIIENNPDECLGKFNDYYFPSQDTTLVTKNFSMLKVPKGALESITHTKDSMQNDMTLSFDEVITFEDITRNYSLVPHKKQYIINAGYFVVKSNHQPNYSTCKTKENFQQVITIRLPLEEQQTKARLKFYAKTYNPDGSWQYKSVPTKREKDKETKAEAIVGSFTAFQLDTIYVGKRVDEGDMSNYFYPAKEGEPGCFRAMGGWLKPYKLDKRASIIMKKDMEALLPQPKSR
ncbi:MAG: hypothetical protein LBM25_05965 [Bacteroidales bacterium]|jgi:hypothetical protein|nr:hypothetical protein [Bacteroidales bacterium]